MNATTDKRSLLKPGPKACLALAFWVLLKVSPAQAPPPPVGTVPPPDHPEVYFSFFYFHDDFSRWLEGRLAAYPVRASTLTQGAAKMLRVDQTELATISSVSRSVVAQLSALHAEVKAYSDQARANRLALDPATLQQFQARRQQLIAAGVQQLTTTLTSAGWSGLHAYINDVHRQGMRRLSPPPALPPPPRPPGP